MFNTWDFLINCFRFASSKTLVFRSSSLSNSRRSVFLSDDDFLSFRLASFSFLCFFFFSFFSFFSFFWKYKNTQHYFPFGWHNLRWPETKRRPKILKHNKIFAYTHFVILLYLHVHIVHVPTTCICFILLKYTSRFAVLGNVFANIPRFLMKIFHKIALYTIKECTMAWMHVQYMRRYITMLCKP